MRRTILISGEPHSGKTTLFRRLVEHHRGHIGGVITEEMVNDAGVRVGFKVRALDTGAEAVLATKEPGGIQLGHYWIDPTALIGVVNPAIKRAIEYHSLICIDEIGLMQLESEMFKSLVLQAMKSGKIVLATMHARQHAFTDRLRESGDVLYFSIDSANRDEVLEMIESMLIRMIHSQNGGRA